MQTPLLLGGREDMANGGWGPHRHTHPHAGPDACWWAPWQLAHRRYITPRFAGHGLVTSVNNAPRCPLVKPANCCVRKSRLQTGCGGLLIEPIVAYRSPVHISLPIIIGAGGAGYSTRYNALPIRWTGTRRGTCFNDAPACFVVEPGIDTEVTRSPGAPGRGRQLPLHQRPGPAGTPKDALHGFNAGFSVKVGRF